MIEAINTTRRPARLSYMEQRELTSLKNDIPVMEQRIEELNHAIAQCTTDYVRLRALSEEQASLADKLASAMERWEDLASRAG